MTDAAKTLAALESKQARWEAMPFTARPTPYLMHLAALRIAKLRAEVGS